MQGDVTPLPPPVHAQSMEGDVISLEERLMDLQAQNETLAEQLRVGGATTHLETLLGRGTF